MKTHNTAWALLPALLIAALALGASATGPNTAQPVQPTLLSYEPVPASPGDVLTIYLQLENTGTETIENVQAEIVPTNTFTPEGRSTVNAGTLPAQQTYVAKYTVRTAASAGSGQRLLQVRTKQEGTDWQTHNLALTVRSDETAVLITDAKSEPGTIEPGKHATLTLTVENQEQTMLRNVVLTLDLDDAPFIPTDGAAREKITQLLSKRTASVEYGLTADPQASADTYKIPVTITFLDEQGETQTQEDTIGLRINTEANTQAYLDGVTRTDENTEVAIRLVNKGLSEIKFVEASIGDGNYRLRTQDEQTYVGNIDTDDWETIRVQLETDQQRVTLPVTYTYTDAYNEKHTATQTFTVDIPQQQSGTSTWTWILAAAIIIAGGGAWWYKKKK